MFKLISIKAALTVSILLLASCSTSTVKINQNPVIEKTRACNQAPVANEKHFIAGYGSLMQKQSRKRTVPNADLAFPLTIKGFQRGWYTKGVPFGYSTTFLGVILNPTSILNGVVYEVNQEELLNTDKRESGYCRQAVKISDINILAGDVEITSTSNVWIYASHPQKVITPNKNFPIVQSYVDIFVSGCLELEEQFKLNEFAAQCLKTTNDWSHYWVNDRLYPRRPFIYQPKAIKIDRLLKKHLPNYFEKITIE